MRSDARQLLRDYPRVFFACHARHRRDPETDERLSAKQAGILDHLDSVEPTGVNELAEHMGVTASTMSIALQRLERRGYLVRERHANDGRRACIRLTDAGERMKQAQSVLDPERVASLLKRLGAQERKQALHGLALLGRAADQEIASWAGSTRKGGKS